MHPQLKIAANKILPAPIHRWLGKQLFGDRYSPPLGKVNLGSLRRVIPVSKQFGFDRGLPVDRYYIEKFLAATADDIQGRVLEIGDASYTNQFGGNKVTTSDVLHINEDNPNATIIGDLTNAPQIPDNSFDCFILTQTLQFIYDVPAALKTIHRILKPGGAVLATFCGISQIAGDEWGHYQCWSFTSLSTKILFEEVFSPENLQIRTYGNVLAATAFLQGLATEELRQEELDYSDRCYELIHAVRGVK
jgi:SAM-dependent methyltransferase